MIKDDILKIRMTKEEKQQIRYFSQRMGFNMSEYVKYCIMKMENLNNNTECNNDILKN